MPTTTREGVRVIRMMRKRADTWQLDGRRVRASRYRKRVVIQTMCSNESHAENDATLQYEKYVVLFFETTCQLRTAMQFEALNVIGGALDVLTW